MSGSSPLLDAVGAEIGDPVSGSRRLAGGSINETFAVELASGRRIFVKFRSDAEVREFRAEAAGLRWLAEPAALPLPAVIAAGERLPWLALEWVEPAAAVGPSEERLGRGLAELHRAGAAAHGELPPGASECGFRIGSVELPSGERPSWAELYGELRLAPLLEMARSQGAIDAGDADAIERVRGRLPELAGPSEPPARLHGDLWSGNILAGADGRPWLIDPAAHGGHREVDLAMLRLFGVPGERLFAAYEEAFPLADAHGERVALWQIMPLLVHAVLFGGAYGRSAAEAARRYL